MKNIIVPCDFSDSAVEALKFASAIAHQSNGKLHVLKVIDLPYMYETTFGIQPYWQDAGLLDELKKEAGMNFDKLRTSVLNNQQDIFFHVQRGAVTASILEAINNLEADLVVMGTKGAGGLKGFFIGSNTEKIVRSSPVPVLSVRSAQPLKSIRSIVFPTLLGLNENELVSRVIKLQEFFGATLHVVRISTPARFIRDKDVAEALKRYAEFYNLKNYTLNVRTDNYEQDGIIRFAREIQADMVAMATHGRKGLAHLITGSIAEDVLEAAMFPIWTFRSNEISG